MTATQQAAGRPAARPRLPPSAAGAAGVVVLAALAACAAEPGGLDADLPPVDAPALARGAAVRPPAPPAAGPRPGRPAMGGRGWRAVSTSSVSGVLLVLVETERLDEMAAIAREVVAPAAEEHLEVLVYFHLPGESRARGRVQWTPGGGYVPLRFSE